MNIFLLDYNMLLNAQYHTDRHVVKMITEYNQLLSSAYYFTDNIPENIYQLTHENHPCSKWARESLSNWVWLRDMTLILCQEYTYRYGRIHAGETYCKSLPTPELIDIGITLFAQAFPDKYKNNDPVVGYRQYYLEEKQGLFKWTKRNIPPWIIQ